MERLCFAEASRKIQMDCFPVAFVLSVVELQGKKWIQLCPRRILFVLNKWGWSCLQPFYSIAFSSEVAG